MLQFTPPIVKELLGWKRGDMTPQVSFPSDLILSGGTACRRWCVSSMQLGAEGQFSVLKMELADAGK